MIDPVAYRVAMVDLKAADHTKRSRWWSLLALWDLMRIVEADADGVVALSAAELGELYGLAETTIPVWFGALEEVGLIERREFGWWVAGLAGTPEAPAGRVRRDTPLAIDPIRYRIHVTRLRSRDRAAGDRDGRRWWPSLGLFGVLRFVEADPVTRELSLTREQLARQYGADPKSFGSWLDLLVGAEFVTERKEGGYRVARLRARRPPTA